MQIRIPVSAGELLDKISILRIKKARMADEGKLAHVVKELEALQGEIERMSTDPSRIELWLASLSEVNEKLWEIEDRIRSCEARRDFSEEFVQLARAVYRTNDERSRIKREINETTGSEIVEEKLYTDPR